MGQAGSISGQFGKYAVDQSEGNRLGQGISGVVYKGRGPKVDARDGIVAVKVIDKARMDVYALRELEMNKRLSELRHPNLVTVLAWKQTINQIYIVMDFYPSGDLYSYIKWNGPLDEAGTARIFAGICNGLSSLHSMDIIHRDLKPMNVLIDKTSTGISARLTDFGFARELNPGSSALSACGTHHYLAPECLQNFEKFHYTKRSDMWSLGTILFEMWTGRRAFEVPPYKYDGTLAPQTKCRTPSWVQMRLNELLRHAPGERLTIDRLRALIPIFNVSQTWFRDLAIPPPPYMLFDVLGYGDFVNW